MNGIVDGDNGGVNDVGYNDSKGVGVISDGIMVFFV